MAGSVKVGQAVRAELVRAHHNRIQHERGRAIFEAYTAKQLAGKVQAPTPPGDLMRFDLTQKILSFDGKPLTDADTPEGYTLGLALIRAALFVGAGENPPAEAKIKQFQLAERLHDAMQAGHIDLTVEDTAMLKGAIGKMYLPLMVGRVWKMLEQQSGSDKPPVEASQAERV